MNFPNVGKYNFPHSHLLKMWSAHVLYEEVINISKVILGQIIILRHLLGKHELPYNNDQVEFLCRRLKVIVISN